MFVEVARSHWRLAIAALAFALVCSGAQAQTLDNLNGQTALQTRTGAAVNQLCANLQNIGTPLNAGTDVSDLFTRCSELVVTGNGVLGLPGGSGALNLGIDNDQLNQALLQVTAEEVSAQGTNTTDIQAATAKAIAGRLSALRGGASGISVAGLQFNTPTGKMSFADLAPGFTAGQEGGEPWYMGRLSAFVSGTIGTGDTDGSDEEIGFDFDFYALTAGVDYRITDTAVLGLALNYASNDSDFDFNGGDMDTDSYGITLYGTASITEQIWIEGSAGYTRNDFDMSRNIVYATINRTAQGDTDGNEWNGSVGVGYDWYVDALSITPTAKLAILRSNVDGFAESGAGGLNLTVEDQDIDSLTSSLGVELSYAISTDFGVLVPGARAAWVHEFDDDSRVITLRYTADPANTALTVITDDPDRNYADAGLSLVAILPGGNSLYLDYATILAHDTANSHALTAGIRIEF
jgi:outer membrane autotransporter protein